MSLPQCGLGQSFTAKDAEDAKEEKSLAAKDAKPAKNPIRIKSKVAKTVPGVATGNALGLPLIRAWHL
jgi:hypothetical protein